MSAIIRCEEAAGGRDLMTYLRRAARIEDGAVRIVAEPGFVAVWVPVLRPQGILDAEPIVLGLRVVRGTIEGASEADMRDGAVDIVVPIRGFLDRFAHEEPGQEIPIPDERRNESWAGVLPTRDGWQTIGELDEPSLRQVAKSGIQQVGKAVDAAKESGDQKAMAEARTSVWMRPIPHGLPAGVAFGAFALGFIAPEGGREGRVQISEQRGWKRVSTLRGHILVRVKDASDPTQRPAQEAGQQA